MAVVASRWQNCVRLDRPKITFSVIKNKLNVISTIPSAIFRTYMSTNAEFFQFFSVILPKITGFYFFRSYTKNLGQSHLNERKTNTKCITPLPTKKQFCDTLKVD